MNTIDLILTITFGGIGLALLIAAMIAVAKHQNKKNG